MARSEINKQHASYDVDGQNCILGCKTNKWQTMKYRKQRTKRNHLETKVEEMKPVKWVGMIIPSYTQLSHRSARGWTVAGVEGILDLHSLSRANHGGGSVAYSDPSDRYAACNCQHPSPTTTLPGPRYLGTYPATFR